MERCQRTLGSGPLFWSGAWVGVLLCALPSCSDDSIGRSATDPTGSGGAPLEGAGGAIGGGAPGSGGTGLGAGGALVGSGGASLGTGGLTASAGGASAGAGGTGLGGMSGVSGGAPGSGGASAAGGSAGAPGTGGAATGTPGISSGCGKSPTLAGRAQPVPAGFGDGGRITIQSGGQDRSFIIRLPDNYDENRPYWLIFGYHWNGGLADDVDSGGTSQYQFSYYGLQQQSNNGAIFVAPQGIGNGWQNPGGRDLTFTDDMLELIQGDLCVDTTHIISTGFSYGAGMSYALACARANVFDAVVLYEGAQLSGCEGGSDPIAFMQLAGLTDEITRIGPARGMRDRFVVNNGCTAQDPPEPPQGSLTHMCTSYSGCTHPVRWCAHGSGHTPAPVDGDPTLVDGVNTWTPPEVWSWLTSL